MKKLIFLFILILTSCVTEVIEPVPPPHIIKSIFDLKENQVTNGQFINFDLPTDGIYTLTLIDKESGQVVSREKFSGKKGENIKKIYTSSIKSQYLYLLLEDVAKKEIGKTTIITR